MPDDFVTLNHEGGVIWTPDVLSYDDELLLLITRRLSTKERHGMIRNYWEEWRGCVEIIPDVYWQPSEDRLPLL